MVTEHAAFLAAILAAPEDDLPRLVFADWLEENGDHDRAEFIRLHIARWRTQERKRYPRPMFTRIAELRKEREATWRTELPSLPGVAWGRYSRGFISEAKFSNPEAFIQHAEATFAAAPIQMVQLCGLGLEQGEAFCRVPQLAGLYGLRLDDVSSESALWRMLTESDWFDHIYHLIVYPRRPVSGWTVSRQQHAEVFRMILTAASRPGSRLKKAHIDMDDLHRDDYFSSIPSRLIVSGLGVWEPL